MDVRVQLPLESVVADPRTVSPSRRTVTTEFASVLPLKSGVVSDVMSSVDEEPLSLLVSRSGASGATIKLSIVNESFLEPVFLLPAASVALTVIE